MANTLHPPMGLVRHMENVWYRLSYVFCKVKTGLALYSHVNIVKVPSFNGTELSIK
jgi:hypothetical protein